MYFLGVSIKTLYYERVFIKAYMGRDMDKILKENMYS